VLKGDKMDDVVRDAVMMGAAAIQPVVTEHSETSLIALARGARRERWQRVAVASAKQCGRAVVPPIAEPAHLTRALAAPAGVFPVMCVEPGLPAGGSPVSQLPATAPAHVSVLVGPEGGWSADEVARHADVAYLLTLGGRTLRADAVALVALTALFAHWREV
jgi:16S rRNA (uracil1498-N3)-methyltransferase